MSAILTMAQKAKEASIQLLKFSERDRCAALEQIALQLEKEKEQILKENARDIQNAQAENLSGAIIDRLTLNEQRLQGMINACREIAQQEQVVGVVVEEQVRPNGLKVQRQRVPLGVVAMIFEGRPNVVLDCACLAIKSGNALLLKGGKEANFSNAILSSLVRKAIKNILPEDCVQMVPSTDRQATQELMNYRQYIDVLIPRGGESLINYVYEHSKVPVIEHFKGLCHIYVHSDADLVQSQQICINAKAQRVGVCNAMETLLVHRQVAEFFLPSLCQKLQQLQIELRGCPNTCQICPQVTPALEEDWSTEYLDRILSIKVVDSLAEAIAHIQRYGTHHTEGICAQDPKALEQFMAQVDASCITLNASTRFNDGGELGLGAELGISTSKLHAYGPMGARELTTIRFIVHGNGHVRA